MKDYYKYCTVSQLKEQIKDTLVSAKEKLGEVSESRRRIDPSYVNKKFYTYVNQIKSKQQQYDTLMNQTNQIEMLLNRRRNKINESLEKYEKSKRSKTLTSFYQPQLTSQQQKGRQFGKRTMTTDNPMSNIQSKFSGVIYGVEVDKGRYQTQPAPYLNINAKSLLIDKLQKRYEPALKTQAKQIKEINASNKLRSITNVVNIRIDNQENDKIKYQKLYSFTKDMINSGDKAYSKEKTQTKAIGIAKKMNRPIFCDQKQCIKQEREMKVASVRKEKKKRAESTLAHKVLKTIKARIRQNEMNNEAQWEARRMESNKTLTLKHQYETMLRKDLKVKLVSCQDIYGKMKEINNLR